MFRRSIVAVAAAALIAAGCGWFEDPTPSEARVLVTGEDGAPVELIVSLRFVAAQSTGQPVRAELLRADTLVRSLPFDTTFDIRSDQRFFAEAEAAADPEPSSFRMRVFLDGDLRYDESGLLSTRVFRFLYIFNQPILTDGEVL